MQQWLAPRHARETDGSCRGMGSSQPAHRAVMCLALTPATVHACPRQGKVRDTYVVGDKVILVTTDRQSAFDRLLASIPFKARPLSLPYSVSGTRQPLSFWRDIAPQHCCPCSRCRVALRNRIWRLLCPKCMPDTETCLRSATTHILADLLRSSLCSASTVPLRMRTEISCCAVAAQGQVLNLTSAWWMQQTEHIVPNALLAVPDPNVSVMRRCAVFPVEFVVRGFMTGTPLGRAHVPAAQAHLLCVACLPQRRLACMRVACYSALLAGTTSARDIGPYYTVLQLHVACSGSTDTSLWTHYAAGARQYCGNAFPDGMRKNDRRARAHPKSSCSAPGQLCAAGPSIEPQGSAQEDVQGMQWPAHLAQSGRALQPGVCLVLPMHKLDHLALREPACMHLDDGWCVWRVQAAAERHHADHQGGRPRRAHRPCRHCRARPHVAG